MSGGGKSPNQSSSRGDVQPQAQQPAGSTMQPFMPGLQSALAQQLQGGFGGDLASIMAMLDSTYQPMTLPGRATAAAAPASAAVTKPAAPQYVAPQPHFRSSRGR